MTQGLLNSAFHDKADGDRRRDLVEFRAQLAGTVLAEVAGAEGVAVEAACLPLFRRSGQGLEQVLRARLVKPAGVPVWLVLDGDGTAGRVPFAEHEGRWLADGFVPEVTEKRQQRFAVVTEHGEVLSRATVEVVPQRKWTVSLVHHTHLDVGYTDRQEVVMANHLQYLDSVLELVDQTSDWDESSRFRWNVEVNWPLERWFALRGPADRRRMVEAVRAGRVSVGAMSLNMHTEACSIEELYEMVRYAARLRSEHGLALTSAMQTDVPGGVPALVEVLADAGVKFLSVAHNYAGRSVPYLIGGEKLGRPFYWKVASGKRLLVWHTDTLHGNAYMEGNIVGLAESLETAEQSLPAYLAALASHPYPFSSGTWLPEAGRVERSPYPHDILHLRVQGRYGDNAPPNLAVSEIARDWNRKWAYPHLKVDRNEDFFEMAVAKLGGSVPEWEGDWADWWADGLGSGARMIGWARAAQGAMRMGRTLNAVSDVLAGLPPAPIAGAEKVYEEIGLFDEHTWGARHPWEDDEDGWGAGGLQWQYKASLAQRAREAAESVLGTGSRRAGELVGYARGLAGVVVLNASGWARTDVVRVFLPYSTVPAATGVALEDERDGRPVPVMVVPQEHVDHRPAGRFLVFVAHEVPALGYARFSVVPGRGVQVDTDRGQGLTVESDRYRVSYSTENASVSSVTELNGKRELVNTEALLGLNAYVFDRYGTSTRVDHLSGRVFSRELDLVADRLTADAAVLRRRESSVLGESMTVDVRAPGASRLLTTINVWNDVPRVEISNRLWKDRTVDKQSVFFAFPLAGRAPELVYELPGAGTSASAPVVPGCPRHMRAVRHWVAVRGEEGGTAWATLDAPLVQFGDIHSPYSPFPGTLRLNAPEPGTIYSWALNNIWDTNFPTEQGGEMRFRYALSHGAGGDATTAGMRLGESVSTPLVGVVLPGPVGGGRGPAAGSLCRVERPEVRLVQAGPAAGGGELLLWLNNLAEEEVATKVEFPDLVVTEARIGDVFEGSRQELTVSGRSVRVVLKPGETKALAVVGRLAG